MAEIDLLLLCFCISPRAILRNKTLSTSGVWSSDTTKFLGALMLHLFESVEQLIDPNKFTCWFETVFSSIC